MSQKYKQYLEQQKRDAEPCAKCGHPRGWHVGDRHCIAREIQQCECEAFHARTTEERGR